MSVEIKQLKENNVGFYPLTVGEAVILDNDETVSSKITSLESNAGNSVKYTEQLLTEHQKNQARKNLDLGYVGEGKKTVKTGLPEIDTSELVDGDYIGSTYKMSDDTPAKEDLISLYAWYGDWGGTDIPLSDPEHVYIPGGPGVVSIIDYDWGYCLSRYYDDSSVINTLTDSLFFVVTKEDGIDVEFEPEDISHLDKGVHCVFWGNYYDNVSRYENSDYYIVDGNIVFTGTTSLSYKTNGEVMYPISSELTEAVSYSEEQDLDAAEQMRARLNQGLYASVPEKTETFFYDGNIDSADKIEFNGGLITFVKVSDRTDLDLSSLRSLQCTHIYDGEYEQEVDTITGPFKMDTIDNYYGIGFSKNVKTLLSLNYSDEPLVMLADNVVLTINRSNSSEVMNGLYVFDIALGEPELT